MRHFDNGTDAPALVAEHHGMEVVKLDLGARIRLVAALVLESLDLEPVAAAVRQPAGGEETGKAFIGLCEREEEVAHRDREEPLVAGEEVGRAGAATGGGRPRRGYRGAKIGASLLLRHRHADRDAGLLLGVQRASVVGGLIDQR